MKVVPAGKNIYADELYLHMVAGRMMFPRSAENFMAYLCLGINDLLSRLLKDEVPTERAFTGIFALVTSLFPQKYLPNVAWDKYQSYIRNARFPSQGKGSLAERTIRGKFAGLLLNLALLEHKSLTEAATLLVERWQHVRTPMEEGFETDPVTITVDNLMQNIWPEYRYSAHLWAAIQDFNLPDIENDAFWDESFPLLRLSDVVEKGIIRVHTPEGEVIQESQTIWPSQFSGWHAFLYKANHIIEVCTTRGNSKGSTKPLLVAEDCWQFPIPDNI